MRKSLFLLGLGVSPDVLMQHSSPHSRPHYMLRVLYGLSLESEFSTPQSTHIRRFMDLNSFCVAQNGKKISSSSYDPNPGSSCFSGMLLLRTLSEPLLPVLQAICFLPQLPAKEEARDTRVGRGSLQAQQTALWTCQHFQGMGEMGRCSSPYRKEGGERETPQETGFPRHQKGAGLLS